MARSNKAYQCWFCYKAYPPEELGRLSMTDSMSRAGKPVFRVVCNTCYYAVCIYMRGEADSPPPVYHGF